MKGDLHSDQALARPALVTCTFVSRSVSQIRTIRTSPELMRRPVSCSQSTTIPAPGETQQEMVSMWIPGRLRGCYGRPLERLPVLNPSGRFCAPHKLGLGLPVYPESRSVQFQGWNSEPPQNSATLKASARGTVRSQVLCARHMFSGMLGHNWQVW